MNHIRITSYNVCYTKLLRNLVVSWIESYGERLKGIYCPDNIMSVSKAVKDLGREDIICVAPGSTESGVLMLKEDYLDAITFQSSELDGELPVKVAAEWFDGLRISPIYYLRITSYNVCYTKLLRQSRFFYGQGIKDISSLHKHL